MRATVLARSATIWVLCLCLFSHNAWAIGQARYVEDIQGPGSFPIVQGDDVAILHVDTGDWPGVIRAVNDLQADIARVTDRQAKIAHDAGGLQGSVILVGTLGRSPIIDGLAKAGKIDPRSIAGQWESFLIQVVPEPLPGVAKGLVIVGSDKRGTIYGIYDLSEQMGVSPWYWWADVPVVHKDALFVKAGRTVRGLLPSGIGGSS